MSHRAAGEKTNIPNIEERVESVSSTLPTDDVWGEEPIEEENTVTGQ